MKVDTSIVGAKAKICSASFCFLVLQNNTSRFYICKDCCNHFDPRTPEEYIFSKDSLRGTVCRLLYRLSNNKTTTKIMYLPTDSITCI